MQCKILDGVLFRDVLICLSIRPPDADSSNNLGTGAKPVQCFNFGSVRWLFTHSLMFRAETGMFRVFNNVGTEQSQAEQNIPQSIRGRESPIQDWSAMKMSLFGFSQQYTQSSFMC